MALTLRQKSVLIWALRIFISLMFIVSAFSKMLPAATALEVFAKQIVDIGVTNWCYAPLLARAIVGFELFLGLAMLQNNYLRNLIIPATFLLLLAFCIHLTITIFTTGNIGSCGCFGDLIPMTPLEAIIKNLIAMAVLVWLFLKITPKQKDNIVLPLVIFVLIYVGILIFLPPKCCCASIPSSQEIVSDTIVTPEDTLMQDADTIDSADGPGVSVSVRKPVDTQDVPQGRKKVNSIFTRYSKFNTGTVDLNDGKKIVCLYSLDCDHCQESSMLLQKLKKNHPGFPGMYVLALGEESQADDFFSAAGGRLPYMIIDPQKFFQLLDKAQYPPRIVVMDNGNFLGDFLNFEHLDTAAVMRAVNR